MCDLPSHIAQRFLPYLLWKVKLKQTNSIKYNLESYTVIEVALYGFGKVVYMSIFIQNVFKVSVKEKLKFRHVLFGHSKTVGKPHVPIGSTLVL